MSVDVVVTTRLRFSSSGCMRSKITYALNIRHIVISVPNRSTSKRKKRARRTHYKTVSPTLQPCPRCGDMKQPHRVCPTCGYYNGRSRSEEHTSELQSHSDLVCRLLLEKKKKKTIK